MIAHISTYLQCDEMARSRMCSNSIAVRDAFFSRTIKTVGTIPNSNSENKIGTIPKISERGVRKMLALKNNFFISPIKK